MTLNYYTEFLTGIIFNWQHLLKDDDYKKIIDKTWLLAGTPTEAG